MHFFNFSCKILTLFLVGSPPKLVNWCSHSRVVVGFVTTQDLLTSSEGSETRKKIFMFSIFISDFIEMPVPFFWKNSLQTLRYDSFLLSVYNWGFQGISYFIQIRSLQSELYVVTRKWSYVNILLKFSCKIYIHSITT